MHKTVLSTNDVARLFSVTETTVKRWADEGMLRCQKTPGGHRKFPIRSVVEFAETNNFEPCGALTLPDTDALGSAIQVAIIRKDFPVLQHAFIEKALSPDRTDLFVFFSYLYEHRIPLWEIFDRVLQPGMAEIGERWVRGEVSIGQEHRASYETLDALAKLQNEILVKPPTGKAAIFVAVGEELHEIGLRCAANVFESEGWFTHYIGARTPPEAIVTAVKELKPSVVALSLTSIRPVSETLRELRTVGEAIGTNGTRVLLGGSGIPREIRGERWLAAIALSSRQVLDFIIDQANDQQSGR